MGSNDDTNIFPLLAIVALVVVVRSCGKHDEMATRDAATPEVMNQFEGRAEPAMSEEEGKDSDEEGDDLDDEDYQSVGAPYGCTEDCSGHEAGFEWARDNGVTDPAECGGNSNSFIEGCRAYAEELEDRSEEHEDDSGDSEEDAEE